MRSQEMLGYGYESLQSVLQSGSMLSNARRQRDACLLLSRPWGPSEKALEMSRSRQQMPDLSTSIHCADGRSAVSSLMLINHINILQLSEYTDLVIGLSFASCDVTDAHPSQTTDQVKETT